MNIVFMPINKSGEIEEGTTILQAARELGVAIESPCGGVRKCGKCKVLVAKGNDHMLQAEENELLTEQEIARGMRLACCCKVKSDMVVMVPNIFAARNNNQAQRPIQGKQQTGGTFGVVVDVGTTTMEVHVVDLHTYQIRKKLKAYNPQIPYGADVIARITYAVGKEGREEQLQEVLHHGIDQMIREAVEGVGQSVEEIEKIVIVGNTTMSYCVSCTSLKSLAKAPFSLLYEGGCFHKASDIGILPETKAKVFVGPNIGGHVGSDAFAGLLATGVLGKDGCYLLVDIGTNGEILFSDHGTIYACSTAAGPAFEGAGLSYGMRAQTGAITKAVVKEKQIVCQVEGNTSPIGISGSGCIDVLAAMLELGILEETGYLKEQYCFPKGYEVAKNVYLSKEDIRQIQLAKAAIYAGILSLLKVAGKRIEEVDQMYLAGAFGSNLDVKNAIAIGLLPNIPISKVQYVGNAAITGAKEMLRGLENGEEWKQTCKKIQHVELANLDGFQETFIGAINFRSCL